MKKVSCGDEPLTREEVARVIEGNGAARRVPMAFKAWWVNAKDFGAREEDFNCLMNQYPSDIELLPIRIPQVFEAPADAPSYRWMNKDNPFPENTALDAVIAIDDWDQLDGILLDFPEPTYPGALPSDVPPKTEQYRVAAFWSWIFQHLWLLRGMENAFCDFYEYPEQVHRLFRALTDFFKVLITRAHDEWEADAILGCDDIGTQKGPFFSLELFREFIKPYYQEIIEHTHKLGMHFWMHSCGNISAFIPDLIEIGLDVLHPIQKYAMDEREIAEKFGNKICIWAGFDVQQTIPYGTPEDVRREVRYMMDIYYRPEGRLIMTTGNALTPDTSYESLHALLDETLHYGEKLSKMSRVVD